MNTDTLQLSSGHKTVFFKRGKTPSEYILNGRSINLTAFASIEEFRNKVSNTLPKFSNRFSLWLETAYADEMSPELAAALEVIIFSSAQAQSCETLRQFLDVCDADDTLITEARNAKQKATAENASSAESKKYLNELNQVIPKIKQMYQSFEDTKVRFSSAKVESCKRQDDALSLESRIETCGMLLKYVNDAMLWSHDSIVIYQKDQGLNELFKILKQPTTKKATNPNAVK